MEGEPLLPATAAVCILSGLVALFSSHKGIREGRFKSQLSHLLCDPGLVVEPLCAAVSSGMKSPHSISTFLPWL